MQYDGIDFFSSQADLLSKLNNMRWTKTDATLRNITKFYVANARKFELYLVLFAREQ